MSRLSMLSLGLVLVIGSAALGALAWSSTNPPDDTDFAPMNVGTYVDETQEPGEQETYRVRTQQWVGADLEPLVPAYPVNGTVDMLSPRCLTKGLDLRFEFFLAPTNEVVEPQRQIAFDPFAFSPGCAFGDFPWALDFTAAGVPELEDEETMAIKRQLMALTEPTQYTFTEKASPVGESQAEVFRSEPVWLIPLDADGTYSLVERTLIDPYFETSPEFDPGTSARRLPFALASLAAGVAGVALIWSYLRRQYAELEAERDVAIAAKATAEARRDALEVILNATHHELNREITMFGFDIDDIADQGGNVEHIRVTHARLEEGRDAIAVLAQLGSGEQTNISLDCTAEDLAPESRTMIIQTRTRQPLLGVDVLLLRALVRTVARNIRSYGGASRLTIETSETELRLWGDATRFDVETLQSLWHNPASALDAGAKDLALMKRIVRAHDGEARFSALAGEDLEVVFSFGVERVLDVRDGAPSEHQLAQPAPS